MLCAVAFDKKFFVRGELHMETAAVSFAVTSALVQPVVDAINSGLTTLVPIGLGIMATFIGVHLIKRVIYMFL